MHKFMGMLFAGAVMAAASTAHAQSTIYFEDTFDGADLGADWDVVNPNPDAYLVEAGVLTMLTPDKTPATFADAGNILRLKKPVPDSDWTMSARFVFVPQTMGETIAIGVTGDAENSLLGSLTLSSYNYALTNVNLRADKLARGKPTGFGRNVVNIEDRDLEVRSAQFSDRISALQLRLQKDGRKYVASVKFESTNPGAEGAISEEWFTVQQLTSLRPPGDAFTLIFGSNSNDYTPNTGEGLIEVDWVRIELIE